MLNRLFGRPSGSGSGYSASFNKQVDAIQRLAETEEMLTKRRELLEKKMDAELQKARELTRAGKKTAALTCLKKKKLMESEHAALENSLMRVMEQRLQMEGQRTNLEVIGALKQGSEATKRTMKDMSAAKVEKVIEQVQEANEAMQEVQAALATPLGAAADIDEDELLAELGELEAAQLDEALLAPVPVPARRQEAPVEDAVAALPAAPTAAARRPSAAAAEDELAELEREMAAM